MFPGKVWIHLHVVYFAANVSVVLCFCMGDSMGNLVNEIGEVCLHGGLD